MNLFKRLQFLDFKEHIQSFLLGSLLLVFQFWAVIPIGIDSKWEWANFLKNFYNSHPIIYLLGFVLFDIILVYFFRVYPVANERLRDKRFKNQANKAFEDFISDADELNVFAGDISFLIGSTNQLNKFKTLGKNCKIVFSPPDEPELSRKMQKIYYQLSTAGVDLRTVRRDDEKSLNYFRGQIKCVKGEYTGKYIKKISENGIDLYKEVDLEGNLLTKLLVDKFNYIHGRGRHPHIKHILFDLGGVYFSGDYYSDFLEKVNELLKVNIPKKAHDKVLLNKELNTGKIDIIQYISSQIKKEIDVNNAQKIRKMWNNVWHPREDMKRLVKELVDMGYGVYPCSNLDQENGIIYEERNDFAEFTDISFLSYEMKLVKTEEAFFVQVLETLNCCPHQILLIDDTEKNTNFVKKMKFDAIKFNRNYGDLVKKLKEKHILNDDFK